MDRCVGAAARLPESDRKDLAIQALARSETRLDRLPHSGQRAVAGRARRLMVRADWTGSSAQVSSRTWVASGNKHDGRVTNPI